MERVPNELRQDILQYLALEDVKSIRLVSKEWGRLGADYLMKPTLYTLPHRQDFKRLLQISRHPVLESYLKNIVFNLAEMNDYQSRHNIYFLNYTRDSDIRRLLLEDAWKDYAILQASKSEFADDYCNPTILKEAFENFSQVETLEIRMRQCPFENEVLQRLWNVPGTQQAHRPIDSERLSDILIACKSLNLEMFIHDRLSLEFFRQELSPLLIQFSSLAGLQRLSLDLTHSVVFEETEFQGLLAKFSSCLGSMEHLHTLRISFKRLINLRNHSMSPYIFQCTWQKLHSLHLSGISSSQSDFISFLKRHSSSLRKFELGTVESEGPHKYGTRYDYGIEITGSGGRNFFTMLSQTLTLDRFELRGNFRFRESTALQTDGEPAPIDEEDWDIDHDKMVILEKFVLEGGDWPKCWPE